MRPLLQDAKTKQNANNNSTNSTKIICTSCILILMSFISIIAYFNLGAAQYSNSSPAKALHASADTATSYYKSVGTDDIITSLPNLLESTCSTSPTNCKFAQYSGYLLATNDVEIHYWFIEADTTDDPTDRPIMVWTNGGPGCSGMDGLLTEHGPWKVMDNLDIAYNEYAWNREVNMLYLEQPYGVGFSVVSDGDSVVAGDQNAADDMDAVIRNFIDKFPAYASNLFYLSAESWGGHYVPMTSLTILKNNANGMEPKVNFGGFLLGNPYTDFYENTYGFVGDIYGHGLLMGKDWDMWRDQCWDNKDAIDSLDVCAAIYTKAYEASYNANVYALDYPQCLTDEDWGTHWQYQRDAHIHRNAQKFMKRILEHPNYEELNMRMNKGELTSFYDRILHKETKYITEDEDNDSNVVDMDTTAYESCIEYDMANYLNLDNVQSALNVKPTEWEMCSDVVGKAWPDSDYEAFMQEYYHQIIDGFAEEYGLKLCVYSGDDDSVCGLQGTQYWLDRWNGYETNAKIGPVWEQWEDDSSQLGGYYTKYFAQDTNKIALHFITVRSAGHMVPTTQPSRALKVLQKFLFEFDSA